MLELLLLVSWPFFSFLRVVVMDEWMGWESLVSGSMAIVLVTELSDSCVCCALLCFTMLYSTLLYCVNSIILRSSSSSTERDMYTGPRADQQLETFRSVHSISRLFIRS